MVLYQEDQVLKMEVALQASQFLLRLTLALIGLTTVFNPSYAFTIQRTCTIWTLQQLELVGKQGYQFKYDIVERPKNISKNSRFVYSDIELDNNGYIEASVFKKPIFDRYNKFLEWEFRGYFIFDQYDSGEIISSEEKVISKLEFESCRDELLAHKTK